MYPADGKIAKDKGRRVQKIGPVTAWSINFAAQAPEVHTSGPLHLLFTLFLRASSPATTQMQTVRAVVCPVQVRVTTAKGVYTLGKAAASYRAIFEHLSEAAAVTLHSYVALTASTGGNSQASLSEVVAKLARAKVGWGLGSL